jgi:hypothetical protein
MQRRGPLLRSSCSLVARLNATDAARSEGMERVSFDWAVGEVGPSVFEQLVKRWFSLAMWVAVDALIVVALLAIGAVARNS